MTRPWWWHNLYLLQLENYDLTRFWHAARARGLYFFKPYEPRQTIRWTLKMYVVCFLVFLFWPGLVFFLFLYFNFSLPTVTILFVLLETVFYPFTLIASVIVLRPIDSVIKTLLVARAKSKLCKYSTLKIIGIAGSYGKTTTKEFLAAALSAGKRVLKTPENINTPLGIARLILSSNLDSYDIFIVEMGEYKIGDVAAICALTPPDIAIVTGINEAHAERMGSIENAKKAIFEVAKFAKKGAEIYVNKDDVNAYGYAKNFNVQFYSGNLKTEGVKSNVLDQKNLVRRIEIHFQEKIFNVTTNILGRYSAGMILLCYQVACVFDLNLDDLASAITAVPSVPHRLQAIRGQGDVLVIDDSYNGNPDGVREAVDLLSEFTDRRKLFLTPGLVETGEKISGIHKEIGKQLASVADVVILIKNSATPYIAEGLLDNGFAKKNLVWFNNTNLAHAGLGSILKPGDVILFQNDWTDNYL